MARLPASTRRPPDQHTHTSAVRGAPRYLVIPYEENRMTHFEQCLVDILAELTDTGASSISLTTTLDQQGVDSFVALRLARAIHDRSGVEIELESLFDYPTVRELAAYLDARAAQLAGAV